MPASLTKSIETSKAPLCPTGILGPMGDDDTRLCIHLPLLRPCEKQAFVSNYNDFPNRVFGDSMHKVILESGIYM
jgi:hypothetical protein